ncbi:hypothetical protein CTAYLR_008537 [Chrysophaeum taylorii]|uniref:Uncharacterized protein n=1 Tax=Chrysophaeum taylorii TaxID=2483200 RepID=A0AAD7XHY3_9STRA|nr:hypothetical protein CTAYLR_008537 [Chrysophaeum taylorii]
MTRPGTATNPNLSHRWKAPCTSCDQTKLEYEELWGPREIRVGGLSVQGSDECVEFGGEVWPGAKAIARLLAERPDLVRGRRVVELGCGAGLAGLTAASLGAASVTLTDLEPNLGLAAANARANGLVVSCEPLDWRRHEARLECDVVLAADVVYKPSLVAPLLCALREIAYGLLVLANDERSANQRRFATCLESCGFRLLEEHATDVLLQLYGPPPSSSSGQMTEVRFADLAVRQDATEGLGGLVWPGAVALARYLRTLDLTGSSVLELGCGAGLVGLAIADRVASVVLSDELVGLAATNARTFDNATVRVLVWGLRRGEDDQSFDLVIGAELTPYLDAHDDLAAEIAHRLRPTGRAFLTAAPFRSGKNDCKTTTCATHNFINTAARHRLVVDRVLQAPILDDKNGDVQGLDLALDDGFDHTLILELRLASSSSLP